MTRLCTIGGGCRVLMTYALGLMAAAALLGSAPSAMAGEFGLQSFEMHADNPDGSADVQAGSHPFAFTTAFTLDGSEKVAPDGYLASGGDLKDVRAELPVGFVGDPDATPRCTYREFVSGPIGGGCPNDTAVGEAETYFTSFTGHSVFVTDPIYNLEPQPGTPAEFGFLVKETVPVFLDVSLRTGGDYGLNASVEDNPQVLAITGSRVTMWGVPGDPRHDPFRGRCLGENENGGGPLTLGDCPVNVPVLPLLTNPTSCAVPRTATLSVDSWRQPGNFLSKTASLPELSGCEKLDFSPTIGVAPDGAQASTATGLNVEQQVPQESVLNPAGLAEADVKDITVALPTGVQVSPSAADGLLACSEAQIGLHDAQPAQCPDASKIGTIEIATPLLSEPLTGSVYLAAQGENPFGSLIAMYIVAENQREGVLVKVAGRVSLDPVTGRIVTTFEETPQFPYSSLKLRFFGTSRAPLTTPPLCGTYTTESTFAPWSGTPAVHPSSHFQISSGPGGTPCASPRPFEPGFQAGTTNIQAGAFSAFTLTMTRPDADQTLAGISVQLPPGLSGSLSKVPLCPEPQASQGACPEASRIGNTIVSAGLGNDPFTVQGGKVFMTGPYKGAPFGLSILNPAKAGPFDLGYVVVRAKVEVNPATAALTIASDPLPTIKDGIPLQIQHVNVTIDRPEFTLNPTNCDPAKLTGTMTSSEGADASVQTPFQVTNCGALGFAPEFTASTGGKTSRASGASLKVKVLYPSAGRSANQASSQANIKAVKVSLPKQLPSNLKTLQKACPAPVFEANPADCAAESRVGSAVVQTPVLPVPLTGPAYFVSYGGAKFPELVIVLQGYGVTVDLHGETYINPKTSITSSTFRSVPDVPFTSFELTLPQGKYAALAAPGNKLCQQKLTMPTIFKAQNGAEIRQSTPIAVTGCAKHATKTKKHKTAKRGRKG